MTQVVSIYRYADRNLVFRKKPRDDRAKDIRARAGAAGRLDIIQALNRCLTLKKLTTRSLIHIDRLVRDDPDSAVRYINACSIQHHHVPFHSAARDVMRICKTRRDGENPRAKLALALPDPLAHMDTDKLRWA